MADRTPTVLLDGLVFPECPRWHDGRLWFSDVHGRTVWAVTGEGRAEQVLALDDMPAGLGWLPDGRLLLVTMIGRRVLRLDPEGLVVAADLSTLAPFHCNDMVVTADGRAYVGNFGFDLDAGAEPKPTNLVCVEPDGEAWTVVEGLLFPNGMAITDGGRTLLVAESFGQRVSAYTIHPDGSLADSRVWADVRPNVPDGMCVDADGAAWIADPVHNGAMRVMQGAGPVDWVATDRGCYACTLGGEDGRTLFLCTAESSDPQKTPGLLSGRIEAVRVDVPAPA